MCNRYGNDPYYAEGYGECSGGYGYENEGIRQFLRTLSPGTCIVLQYDSQRPTKAVFQGFRRRSILVSNLRGFHNATGFTLIAINKINAVSILSPQCPTWENCEEEC
ncbi:hypothetical protein BK702_00025 [Bacillus thuringiensis serovar cameroun]|nr:hypothetical protein BK702_00025 [Bacillus thuringiensis serovar cameroun]